MYFFASKYKYINYGAQLMYNLHHTTLVYFLAYKYILIYKWLNLTPIYTNLYNWLILTLTYYYALYPIYIYLYKSICICITHKDIPTTIYQYIIFKYIR